MSTLRLTKTDAGRAEIRLRQQALSRPARTLLIVIEPLHDVGHWLAQVQGAQLQHLEELLALGLLAEAPGLEPDPRGRLPRRAADAMAGLASPAAPGRPTAVGPGGAPHAMPGALPRITLGQALQRLADATLYERRTPEARPRLGLIQGYRTILEIERAADVEALRKLALAFVEQVRRARGDEEAQALAQWLADGDRHA